MQKILIGPKLRQIRRQHKQTQSEMARQIGVSPAYINLLESNQRSLSVQLLMALSDAYGLDARTLAQTEQVGRLSELRMAARDPGFSGDPPDLQELRAAIDHAPQLVDRFLALHRNYRTLTERVRVEMAQGSKDENFATTPEKQIFDVFKARRNHFPTLEDAAEKLRLKLGGTSEDMYALLKRRLRVEHGITAKVVPQPDMPDTLRAFNKPDAQILLSEALNAANRVFQLAFVLAQIEAGDEIEALSTGIDLATDAAKGRLTVELTNYTAAALLMPYAPFLHLAEDSGYDLDRLASAFGVTFEQVCHRLITLHRDGASGIPFFLLRVDRAGNVTKRVDSTGLALAQEGGGCPVWNLHGAFQLPGVILPDYVELPEGEQFFTLSRTSDRPVFSRKTQDRRVVVSLGCEARHAGKLVYAQGLNPVDGDIFTEIGINCQLCPRQKCSQRAHRPLHIDLPIDANRRGQTSYES